MSAWQPMETAPRDGSFILIAELGRRSLSYTITRIMPGETVVQGWDGGLIDLDTAARWQPLPAVVDTVEWLRGIERELLGD